MPGNQENKVTMRSSSPVFIIDEESILDSKFYFPLLPLLQYYFVKNTNAYLYIITSSQSTHSRLGQLTYFGITSHVRDMGSLQYQDFINMPAIDRNLKTNQKAACLSLIHSALKEDVLRSSIYFLHCDEEIAKVIANLPEQKPSAEKTWYENVLQDSFYLNDDSKNEILVKMGCYTGFEQYVGSLLIRQDKGFGIFNAIKNHAIDYLIATKQGSFNDCRADNNATDVIEKLYRTILCSRLINLIDIFIEKNKGKWPIGKKEGEKKLINDSKEPALPIGVELITKLLPKFKALKVFDDEIWKLIKEMKEIVSMRRAEDEKLIVGIFNRVKGRRDATIEFYKEIDLLLEKLLTFGFSSRLEMEFEFQEKMAVVENKM